LRGEIKRIMSYIVLARKWRPQVFDDLVGQPHIVKVLRNTISQKKVHHAYVFSGPRGVGKTTTARILAKSLNCINGPTPDPCGKCQFCVSITDGSSMDVIEIDGASNNSVDDIREIRERVKYAPSVSGKYKVYIIDEAHMLSESAFNALLKTIEEPPPHTIFVLATTAYRKIPATVLSRCQHLSFRRIPRELIVERLRYIANKEGIKISDDSLDLIARAADGSMRDSLTLLDQVSSFADDITFRDVADLLGLSDSRIVAGLAEALFRSDQRRLLALIAEIVNKGVDLRTVYKDLIVFLRDMLIFKTVERDKAQQSLPSSKVDIKSIFELSDEEMEELKRLSNMVSVEELLLMLNDLIRSESDIRNATFPRIAFEVNLIKISLFKEFSSLRGLIDDLKVIRENLPTRGVPDVSLEKKTEQPGVTASKEDSLQISCEEIVAEFRQIVEERDHVLFSKLKHADINFKKDSNGVTAHFVFNGGHAFLAKSVIEEEDIIKNLLEELLGSPVRIKIVSSEKKETGRSFDNFKKEVLSRPEVREIIELFEGSVIEVRRIEENN